MSDKLDRLDYYTLLGVGEGADTRAVKKAFRKFARRYHPDRFGSDDVDKRERAERIYRRGSEAFQVLTDPDSRAAYDRALAQGKVRLTEDTRRDAQRRRGDELRQKEQKGPPIRNPEALTLFREAVGKAKTKDWVAAYRLLKRANEIEPGNAFLESRFRQAAQVVRRLRG